MKLSKKQRLTIAGTSAGLLNGFLGTGGGMLLVPQLTSIRDLDQNEVFPTSVAIILPVCIVSLSFTALQNGLPWEACIPYLIGGSIGGILSGLFGKKIPVKWLHRIFGVLIFAGGIRYLW